MGTLFDIQVDYRNLLEEIEQLEGELTPELEEKLTINQAQLESKVKAYYYLIKEAEATQQLIKDEIDRLKNVSKTKENVIEKLKKRLLEATITFGDNGNSGNKVLTIDTLKLFTASTKAVKVDEEAYLRKSNTTLEGLSNNVIDYIPSHIAYRFKISNQLDIKSAVIINDFCKHNQINIELVPDISKTLIKCAIEDGITIDNAEIVTNVGLRIK